MIERKLIYYIKKLIKSIGQNLSQKTNEQNSDIFQKQKYK